MSVITFDVNKFRTDFPAFANATTYPDATLQGYFDAATCFVSPQNCGTLRDGCRARALNLMTAHLAALADIIASGQTPGQVQSATIDKVSVTMTPPPNKNQWSWWLGLTPYGQQLLALLAAKSVGGFYVGGSPEGSAFRKVYGVF